MSEGSDQSRWTALIPISRTKRYPKAEKESLSRVLSLNMVSVVERALIGEKEEESLTGPKT